MQRALQKKKKVYGKQLYGKCVSCSYFEKSILAIRFKADNCRSRAKMRFKSWASQLNQQIWCVEVKYFVSSLFLFLCFSIFIFKRIHQFTYMKFAITVKPGNLEIMLRWNISFARCVYWLFSIFVFKDVTFNLQYKRNIFSSWWNCT